MSTVKTNNLQHLDASTPNIALDQDGNAVVAGILVMGSSFMRNRIINGDMRRDARNSGAAINNIADFTYTVDRWLYQGAAAKFNAQQNAGAVAPPPGFKNYLGFTVSSAVTPSSGDYFRVNQRVEGFNVADLGWGAAGAKSVTFSIWVRSSLTGTFGGSVMNSAGNRSYPFPYTINAANTWERKIITIPGDTSGAWLTDSGIGLLVGLSLGSGSTFTAPASAWAAGAYHAPNGSKYVADTLSATFYMTGAQLEDGIKASPFERRHVGTEDMLCKRYFEKVSIQQYINFNTSNVPDLITGVWSVEKRANPTIQVFANTNINVATALGTTGWSAGQTGTGVANGVCAATLWANSEL